MTALAFVALATHVFAAEKKVAVTAAPAVQPMTKNGQLALPKFSDGELRIGLSTSGKIIVPPPYDPVTGFRSTDPAEINRWEATARYVNDNFPYIEATVQRLVVEARTNPDPMTYINQGLRSYLKNLGAAEEIARIDATMVHQVTSLTTTATIGKIGKGFGLPVPPPTVQACGPRGTCLTSVITCTGDGPGDPTDCHVQDCISECGGCCGYGVKHIEVRVDAY